MTPKPAAPVVKCEKGPDHVGPCKPDGGVHGSPCKPAAHTKTPWKTNGTFRVQANDGMTTVAITESKGANMPESLEECKQNAAHIVKCVNTHHELLVWVNVYHNEACSKSHPDKCDLCQLIARAEVL